MPSRSYVFSSLAGRIITRTRFSESLLLNENIKIINVSRRTMSHESFACLKSWGESVKAKNKPAVLDHYAENGTLWPTLSNELRKDEGRIGNYFDSFLAKID